MKKVYLTLMVSALFLGIISCNSDVDEQAEINTDQADFILSATYKGIQYEVPGKYDEAGNPVYLNKQFNDLFLSELSRNSNLATVVLGDNTVEYYESIHELFDNNNLNIIELQSDTDLSDNNITTRATGGQSGRVIVNDDTNYKDRDLTFDIGYVDWWAIPQLRDFHGFNDKISSIRIWSYINPGATIVDAYGNRYSGSDLRVTFVGYEHDNYRGKVLLCLCPPNSSHMDPKLKSLGWNDKITALRVLITSMNNGKGNLDNIIGTPGYPSITPYSPH